MRPLPRQELGFQIEVPPVINIPVESRAGISDSPYLSLDATSSHGSRRHTSNAESLKRSRYSAYDVHLPRPNEVIATTSPRTRVIGRRVTVNLGAKIVMGRSLLDSPLPGFV